MELLDLMKEMGAPIWGVALLYLLYRLGAEVKAVSKQLSAVEIRLTKVETTMKLVDKWAAKSLADSGGYERPEF